MRDRFFTCVRYENPSNMVVYDFPQAFLRRFSAVPRNKPHFSGFFEKRSLAGGGKIVTEHVRGSLDRIPPGEGIPHGAMPGKNYP